MWRVRSALLRREAGAAAAVGLAIAGLALAAPRFFDIATVQIFLLAIPLVLAASMGELLVVIARQVDISIGSILALSAMIAGMAFRDIAGLPVWAGFVLGTSVGAAAGLVNAVLVNGLRINSIIATLATLNVFRGIVFVISGGHQISADQLPAGLLALAQTGFGVVPWLALIAIAPFAIAHVVLVHTSLGRHLFAIGSNPDAARLRGLPVGRTTGLAFVLSGAAAGLAGVMYVARFGVVNPSSAGVGFELSVIAAVIVGGVSIGGGVGSATGALLGVGLIGIVQVALPMLNVSHVWQGVIFGFIVVCALLVDRLTQGGLSRLTRSSGASA